MDELKSILASDFMPHGHCYFWNPVILWLNVISDAAITIAYYSIPVGMFYFVRRRPDLQFGWLVWMFAAFIMLCGTTHAVALWNVWNADYAAEGLVKAVTAAVSVATAVALWPAIPKLLNSPSSLELASINAELRRSITRREASEAELRRTQLELEGRVHQRTAALEAANEALKREVAERDKAEERFRKAVESSPNAMLMVDSRGKVALANRTAEKIFGYQREELIGARMDMLVPERFQSNHPRYRKQFLASPQTREMGAGRDLYALRKDGREIPVEIGLNPIYTNEGLFVLSSIVDITERKRLEERFRATIESAPTAMVMIGAAGTIMLVNRETEKLFGYDRNDLLGRSVEVLLPDRFRENHPNLREMFFGTPAARRMGAGRDLFGMRKDGSEFPVEIGLNPVETDEGTFVLSAIVDISERKKSEQMIQAQNMQLEVSNRELDQFAHVVSHDLKAPLRGITSLASFVMEDCYDRLPEESQEHLNHLISRTERMGELIDGILRYSRAGRVRSEFERVDSKAVALEALDACDPPDEISIRVDDDMPTVYYDPVQLLQVFQNLLANAITYMGKPDGEISISCRDRASVWEFSVQDDGAGIEQRHFDRIFKMFQTLYPDPEKASTGVGLAIVKKLVEKHGGKVSVDSRMGEGTTFRFTIPKVRRAEMPATEQQEVGSARG